MIGPDYGRYDAYHGNFYNLKFNCGLLKGAIALEIRQTIEEEEDTIRVDGEFYAD